MSWTRQELPAEVRDSLWMGISKGKEEVILPPLPLPLTYWRENAYSESPAPAMTY